MPSASGAYLGGLAETRKWLAEFEPRLVPVLRDELKRAVNTTVRPAVAKRVPLGTNSKKPGRARASVRAVSGGNTVYVAAGSPKKVPYFGWLDFGGVLRPSGKRHNPISREVIKGGRYLYPGIDEGSPALVEAAGRAVERVINLR